MMRSLIGLLLKCATAGMLVFGVHATVIASETQDERNGATESKVSAPENSGNFYVFREYAEPTIWLASLKVDGKKIVSLGNKTYTSFRLTPGSHTISINWSFLSGQRNNKIQINVREGQVYYFEVTGVSRFASLGYQSAEFNMGSQVGTRDAELASTRVRACCHYKKARKVPY